VLCFSKRKRRLLRVRGVPVITFAQFVRSDQSTRIHVIVCAPVKRGKKATSVTGITACSARLENVRAPRVFVLCW